MGPREVEPDNAAEPWDATDDASFEHYDDGEPTDARQDAYAAGDL
jgi:hypothetical protein